jgi:hypothetical protein
MLSVRIDPMTDANAANVHAKAVIKSQRERVASAYATPFVPNAHRAHYPHCCPSCGVTVWSFVDKYDVRCDLCKIPVYANDDDE